MIINVIYAAVLITLCICVMCVTFTSIFVIVMSWREQKLVNSKKGIIYKDKTNIIGGKKS